MGADAVAGWSDIVVIGAFGMVAVGNGADVGVLSV